MTPLMLQGEPALSGFRLIALLNRIRKAVGGSIADVSASYVYMIDAKNELSADALAKTQALLQADEHFEAEDGFYVIPRKGTISPWSSKATDIFRNCGISEVLRVERGIHYRVIGTDGVLPMERCQSVLPILYDRMTQGVYKDVFDMFEHMPPVPFIEVDIVHGGKQTLQKANVEMGLALSDDEIDYLYNAYQAIARNPTDVELVMFGQVNSEHCRHKIFNADWIIDGQRRSYSLFGMIKNTHDRNPVGTLVAYKDNSGVVEGFDSDLFRVDRRNGNNYCYEQDCIDIIMKVETHNHPTAISPYPGAATGVGGEIRDESATGVGSKSKAGLSAFFVSNLHIPGFVMPWEKEYAEFPERLATPLEIMTDGPIGSAGFGNEYGRPQLFGLFKTFEQEYNGRYRGYHKPIMVAGGMGNILRKHVYKKDIPSG
ncbi:MAG: phosphoribosylformylglycinamidine synthase, partial [Lentisphaerae bacterium]|nr:phosphoribosylformylglycinamidine synthase [Lentisphaerota bacterium]